MSMSCSLSCSERSPGNRARLAPSGRLAAAVISLFRPIDRTVATAASVSYSGGAAPAVAIPTTAAFRCSSPVDP
jgi:hypothetical protein